MDLKISLIQTALHWEAPGANRAMLEEKIWEIREQTDLIILPEMFTSGFTMNAADVAEVSNLHTEKWMKQMASQTGAVVAGSFIVKDGERYFNRFHWVSPEGDVNVYDKRHLFRMAGEHEVFSAGKERIILDLKGWKICPLVCYDLRFPVWSRSRQNEYDLLLYVANWPEARRNAWNILLQARAVENLAYVAGVNRVGEDGQGITYSGDSAVINFKGEILKRSEYAEEILTKSLSKDELEAFRNRFPAWMDADEYKIY